jgi:hypothetical protein
MKQEPGWVLQKGVKMDADTASEVAKIACAFKALSAYTALVLDHEDDSEELQKMVQDGLEAMNRVFKI